MKRNQEKLNRNSDTKRGNAVIVCPPDRAGRSLPIRILGIVCRYLIAVFAVYGLLLMIDDSVRTYVGAGYLLIASLVSCAIFAVMFVRRLGALVACVGSAAYIAVKIILDRSFVTKIVYGVVSVYNSFMDRLVEKNFLRMSEFMVDIDTSAYDMTQLYRIGLSIVAIFLALVFVPFMIKRTRLILPAIVSTLIIVVVCTYNMSNAKWALAFIIASFGAILVLNTFDKYYIRDPAKNNNSAELQLFGSTDRPDLPDVIIEQERLKKERSDEKRSEKEKGAVRRKQQKEHTLTIDEEISDYFSSTPRKKPKKEKKEKKIKKTDEKRAEKKTVAACMRRIRRYDKATLEAKAAMGGFAGIATFIILMIAVSLPAFLTDSNFSEIPAISEKLTFYRTYLTAFLRGDEVVLDDLEYARDYANFAPRTTEATDRKFKGTPYFRIETSYFADVYLTGWIATEYRDGAWYTANYNGEDYNNYRGMYSAVYDRTSTPYEDVFFNFMNAYLPYDMYEVPFEEDRIRINTAHGVLAEQVNIKRLSAIGTQMYLPSRFNLDYNLRKYGSSEKLDTKYVNFYDGIYTGKAFGEAGAEYAAVSYMMIQRNSAWINTLSYYIAEFNEGYDQAYREVLNPRREKIRRYSDVQQTKKLIMNYLYDDVSVSYTSNGGIMVTIPEKYIGAGNYFINTVSDKDGNITVYCNETGIEYTITPELEIMKNGPRELPFAVRYCALMSEAEKLDVASMFYDYYVYSSFAYETYTDKADSEIISNFYQEILAGLSAEEHSDIMTDGNGNYALPNTEKSPLVDVHKNRHQLVMKVIDTLAAKDSGYTYTLEPEKKLDPKLDGVENFLTVTKEGYCVQFASAAALILREAGIPVRYVEGYLASDMVKSHSTKSGWSYSCTVRDSDAHSWIEVWYDGIGWVRYETTPAFYNDAYGIIDDADPDDPDDPPVTLPPEDTDDEIEDTTLPDDITTLPDDTSDPLSNGNGGNGISRETFVRICVIGGVILLLAIIFAIVAIAVVKRAERHREEKEKLLNSAESGDFTEDERHAVARSLIDMTMTLLRVYGTPPGKSELRTDYAKRLENEYLSVFGKRKYVRNLSKLTEEEKEKLDGNDYYIVSDTDFTAIFDSMAAEEFGLSGMTREEIHDLAVFYKRLYGAMPARLSPFTIFKHRYFKFI